MAAARKEFLCVVSSALRRTRGYRQIKLSEISPEQEHEGKTGQGLSIIPGGRGMQTVPADTYNT